MINLQVKRAVKLSIDKSIILRAAELTLESENLPSTTDVSIIIADDKLLHRLNKKYRQMDVPTDVLSFPSNDPDPDTQSTYLGDVIISLPRAQEQAFSGGHSLADELQLLAVHGILHLLGYDHLKRADRKKMQSAQDKVLSQLGVKLALTL